MVKLFRVEGWGKNMTMQVSGSGSPPGASQTFKVSSGPYLQVIDLVEDMGNGHLHFANGPATIRPGRDARLEAMLKAQD